MSVYVFYRVRILVRRTHEFIFLSFCGFGCFKYWCERNVVLLVLLPIFSSIWFWCCKKATRSYVVFQLSAKFKWQWPKGR